ncbi:hypothetical protein [Bradyrhizobium sp. Tv2a-2]|uniref:hypothetical protein n=1 Tax=Bradyrhizobium sp. Tv2a-2 TaxID=113395 RepID=UPI000428B8D7|nr:hypothetical protein [Bradyrhizobium sp. Tv2a-2]
MTLDFAHKPRSAGQGTPIAHALPGGGLPHEVDHHLWRAGLCYHLDEVAESHLRQALALAPGRSAVLIGLYRFYFYKGRLSEALEIARCCVAKAARESGLPDDWPDVNAVDAAFGRYENILSRFYLFSLKAYAYLQMRLGNLDEGRAAAEKLLELDPTDKIGGKVLLEVIEGMGKDDDD